MSTLQTVTLSGYQIFGTPVYFPRDLQDCRDYLEETFGHESCVLESRVTCGDHSLIVEISLAPEILRACTAEEYVNALVNCFIGIRDAAAEEAEDEAGDFI